MYLSNNQLLKSIILSILNVGFVILFSVQLQAQDYGWWNTLVQWDGRSHWSEYLIYTPKYFGPNAIPVPEIKNGKIHKTTQLELGLAAHFSEGDDAQNLTTRLYIPITNERVGLQIYVVPYERYKMTPEIRDLRRARDFDGEGFAFGDIHLGTWVQLTNPSSEIDLLLTLNIKTASGSNREATRFTDGSGYNFDLSAGRSFKLQNGQSKVRPYAQIGFYVWETNEDKNPQNDAFSFGVGSDWKIGRSTITTQLGGFIGYKGDGDKPVISRINYEYLISDKLTLKVGAQYGFRDNLYRSFFLSMMKEW